MQHADVLIFKKMKGAVIFSNLVEISSYPYKFFCFKGFDYVFNFGSCSLFN